MRVEPVPSVTSDRSMVVDRATLVSMGADVTGERATTADADGVRGADGVVTGSSVAGSDGGGSIESGAIDSGAIDSGVNERASKDSGSNDSGSNDFSPVVLFDGVCNLCNAAVRFIIDRDPKGTMRFASLQSDVGQELVARHATQLDSASLPSPDNDAPPTLLLVEDGRIYARSTAALRIARRLNGLWPVFGAFLAVPRSVRDPVYDFVANRRYRWFGRTDACRLPTKEEAGRFLG